MTNTAIVLIEIDWDILPMWPSGDDQLEDTLNAIMREGFFVCWPPDDTVSFYLYALLGYEMEFLQEFVEMSCSFSKETLQLISSYTFHNYSADVICNYLGDCIVFHPCSARVRTSI